MLKLGGFGLITYFCNSILEIFEGYNYYIINVINDYILPTRHVFWTVFISAYFLHTII